MKNIQITRYFLAFALMLASTVLASAQVGPQIDSLTSDSYLNLTATAQTALQLDITTGAGGAAVTGATGNSSTGVFGLDFGNVNGLGMGTPSTGVSVSVQTGGAVYTTPITLTPRYSGFTSATSSVSVMLDSTAGNAMGRDGAREGGTAAAVAVPSALIPNIFKTDAVSGTSFTRYAGVFVSNANGVGAVNGAMSSRLVYQITVP